MSDSQFYEEHRYYWGLRFRKRPISAGIKDKDYDLLDDSTKIETRGQIQDAIAASQRIADNYSHTQAGLDARKSIQSLLSKIGN